MKVIIDGKEYVAKDSVPEWIYEYYTHNEICDLFEKVEKALGIKLFVWQKSYIETGTFRKFGATTAECLRILLKDCADPVDYSMKPKSIREDFFRRELKRIKEKLDAAGIKTRTVFFCANDKKMHQRKTDYFDSASYACKWIQKNMHDQF